MGRPSTARTARARAFGRWSGGLCTHLDGEALIMLLKQLEEGGPPNDTAFESSLVDVAPKRHLLTRTGRRMFFRKILLC